MREPTVNTNTPVAIQDSAKKFMHPGAELVWDGIRVRSNIYLPPPDRVAAPSRAEHRIVLHLANQDYLERRLDGGKLLCAPMSPGLFNFVPAHRESESLWQAEVELLEIYLPAVLLERVAIESCDRVPRTIELIDRFAIPDPFLEQLAYAFKAELERGKPSVSEAFRSRSVPKGRNRLYLESLQTVLAGHLLRHHCSVKIVDAPVSGGLSKSTLHQVVDYIQNNLDRDISLAELARVAHMSVHHFGKLFKQSMGVTPHQYVLKCRVEQAKKLLANKQLSLAEISQALGFCHQSHFIDVFRRYTSLTPRQYRNKL